MKKVLALLVAAVMTISFAACGNNSGNSSDPGSSDPGSSSTDEGISSEDAAQ